MHEDRKAHALLRFHYEVDPDTLSDEDYYKLWNDYLFVRGQNRKLLLGVMRQVIEEAFPSQS